MKKALWIAVAVAIVLAFLAAGAIAAYLLWGLPQEIGIVTVNGRVVDWSGANAGHWVLATLGILLAVVLVLVVLPLAAVAVFIVPLAVTAFGLALAALALGLLLSPLILLIWWLWKRSAKPDTIAA